jgi:hypothetical protein
MLVLAQSFESEPEKSPPLLAIAYLYLRNDDLDRTFEYLERSFEQREPDILRLNDPEFDGIRTDPRFQDIVRRIGLPQRPGA